jgi:hypothetical protein
LVPKPVVAGHGVKELLGMPSLALLGLLVGLLIITFVSGYTRTRFGERAQRYVLWILILLMIGLAFGVVYRSLKHHHFDVATTLLPEHMPLHFYIPMNIIALLAAIVSVRVLQHGLTIVPNSTVPRISKLKYVVGAALVAFADFFFLGFVGAAYEVPPLPSVEIHGSEQVQGALLAHAERFWYVIDEDGQLVVTPDTEVTSVQVLPKRN